MVTSSPSICCYTNLNTGRDQAVSAHPLGGANISRDGTGREGVTNHLGEVFSGHGSEIYPRLVCCDASVVPTALSKQRNLWA